MGSSASQTTNSQQTEGKAAKRRETTKATPVLPPDLGQLSLSPEETCLDDPQLDEEFQPNFTEFPSHVTLRHENVRYWKWRKKHPEAAVLRQGFPDPDVVRKKDVFQLKDFMAADQRALSMPVQSLDQSLEEVVAYLIQPFRDDLRRARVLFCWICCQDMSKIQEEGADETARYYLFGVNCGFIAHSELYLLMCRLAHIECEMIEGVTKASQYNAGDTVSFTPNSSWNAVRISQSWHLLDVSFACRSTNKQLTGWHLLDDNGEGRRTVGQQSQDVEYEVNEFYFLTNPEEFVYNHFPAEEGWQLLARPVTSMEFQAMAYLKTSFFEMDMQVLREKRCKLCTQSEEILLKLGLPTNGARHFAYQLYKSSTDKNWDFKQDKMARFVFLEQKEGAVFIKVMFPVSGNYTLSLFVSDTDSGSNLSYSWVADYMLVCEGNKHGRSALPTNLRYEWGPGHDTQRLGMTPVTHPHGAIDTDDGETEVTFNLSSLVDILTQLRGEGKDEESLQQSLLQRTEGGKLSINLRLQEAGTYALDIYAKQQGDSGTPTLVCTYLVNNASASLEPFKFPRMDGQTAGPLKHLSMFNLIPVSHKESYFTSKQGFENFLFKYSSDLTFKAEVVVETDKGPQTIENHVFIEQTDSQVAFKVRFPESGIYCVTIYAKNQSDGTGFKSVYRYMVHVPVRMKDCQPFPIQYMRLGCKVDGLDSGYLVEGQKVKVEVTVPGAQEVQAECGGQKTSFSKTGSGQWTAELETGKAGKPLQLLGQFDSSQPAEPLFEYQVRSAAELAERRQRQEEEFVSEQNKHKERETQRDKKAQKLQQLRQDLQAAIEAEDQAKLQKLVHQVEKGCYTSKLSQEYTKAKELIKSLERIERLKKSILQMNNSTMAEIRSYNHPPAGVHGTMMSTLLLLKHHQGTTKDWKQCQALCNTSTLSKSVARFDVKGLHVEVAARARVLLQGYRVEDIAQKSAGAAAFYSWVVGMTEELDHLTEGAVSKATPANIRRQKNIFSQT